MLFNLLHLIYFIVTERYTVQITVQLFKLKKQTLIVLYNCFTSCSVMFILGHQDSRKRNYGLWQCQHVYPTYSPLFCSTRGVKRVAA
jgi:hypothetical protein